MNNDRILLSETLDRITNAVGDIRTAVDMTEGSIEDVADAVEALAEGEEYNAFVANTIEDMLQITDKKEGDWCMVTNDGYQYSSCDSDILSSVFTFPRTFTYLGEIEEFADVDFNVISFDGHASFPAGNVSLTKGGSSSGSSSSGSGSGGSENVLSIDLKFAGNVYIDSFSLSVRYTFDEEENLWTRNDWSDAEGEHISILGDTVMFPAFGWFHKQGAGVQPLPVILNQAILLGQRIPFASANTGPMTFDALYLPTTVSLPELPSAWSLNSSLALVDNPSEHFCDAGYSDSPTEYQSGWNYFSIRTREEQKGRGADIDITYKLISQETGNMTYAIKSIVIKDKKGNYLYNLPTFGSSYEGWNCYIYLPEELCVSALAQWNLTKNFFVKADIKKARTYLRKSNTWLRRNTD